MPTPIITRELQFDAGHRVWGHESKCAHLHGHRYVAQISVQAKELDSIGRVVDFSVIKERVGKWIDDNWDHNILLHPEDPLLKWVCKPTPKGYQSKAYQEVFGIKHPFIMPEEQNPTAENMAIYLYHVAGDLLPTLKLVNVRIYETPNCWADYPGSL